MHRGVPSVHRRTARVAVGRFLAEGSVVRAFLFGTRELLRERFSGGECLPLTGGKGIGHGKASIPLPVFATQSHRLKDGTVFTTGLAWTEAWTNKSIYASLSG